MKRTIFKRILLFGVGLLILGLFLLYMYLNELGPFGHDVMYVPDYPGAQNVLVLLQQDPRQMDFSTSEPYKVVTFVTTDNPNQVFAFFKDKLLSRPFEDWRPYMVEQTLSSFRIVGFGPGPIGASSGGPMYTFVATTEQKNRLTHVRVERYFFGGM